MSEGWRGTLAGVVLGLSSAAHAASEPPTHQVRVRMIDGAIVDSDTWAPAQMKASRILKQAGIELTWVLADQPDVEPQLFLVLTDSAPRTKAFSADSLGVARSRSSSQPLVAYIFMRRITDVARDGEQPISTVLGHVIAHELGHLLLATSFHSARGLMQGQWDRETLLVASQGRLLFTSEEAQVMRVQLTAAAAIVDRSRY